MSWHYLPKRYENCRSNHFHDFVSCIFPNPSKQNSWNVRPVEFLQEITRGFSHFSFQPLSQILPKSPMSVSSTNPFEFSSKKKTTIPAACKFPATGGTRCPDGRWWPAPACRGDLTKCIPTFNAGGWKLQAMMQWTLAAEGIGLVMGRPRGIKKQLLF